MKFFTIPALLVAALAGVVVVIPWLPTAKARPEFFGLEIRHASSRPGNIKVYFDIGAGYREEDSVSHPITVSETPLRYRLTLPIGEYRSLRIDPIDGPGMVVLEGDLRITTLGGRIVRTSAQLNLEPLHQIAELRRTPRGLEVHPAAGADDPQLRWMFSQPLKLGLTFSDWLEGLLPRAAPVFAALALLLFALERLPKLRTAARLRISRLARRPGVAISVVAAAAVTLSAYPVLFLGKSFVSPNFGTSLLYETLPTLPGYTTTAWANVNGSDVGAALWYHIPTAAVQRRALAHGELPLWNRYTLTGNPLIGQGQSMFGDPLHIVTWIFERSAWAWDLKIVLAKWLFATGLGLTLLAILRTIPRHLETTQLFQSEAPEGNVRITNITRPEENVRNTNIAASGRRAWPNPQAAAAALIVTAAAPFMGFFLYRINHAAIFSVCYSPWILYGWCGLATAASRRSATWALLVMVVANCAVMNSGTVKEAYLLLVQMNLAGAGILLLTKTSWRARLLKLAAALWAGALLVMITMPIWATFLRALRGAFTASMTPAVAQIQPSLLLGAFDEVFFRPLSQGEMVFNPALNFLLLLGLLYFLATLRLQLKHGPVVALGVCSGVSAAIVFGVVPPGLLWSTPFLANIGHIENCFLCGLLVTWSLLAGAGFYVAAFRIHSREGRGDLLVGGLLLLGLVSLWIGFRQAAHRNVYGPGTTFSVVEVGKVLPVSVFVWASLVSLLLAGVALALTARRALVQQRLSAAGFLVITLCGVVLLWRQGAHASALGFESYLLQPPVRAPFDAKSPAMEFVRARHLAEPSRILGLHGNVTPGWNAVEGLESIYGADALQPPWLRELIDVFPLTWISVWRLNVTTDAASKARPFLDLMNVRYYLDFPTNRRVQDDKLPLVQTADLAVYESRTAWPRAFFTNHMETYERPADLAARISSGDGRPFAAVYARDPVAARQPNPGARKSDSRSVVAATDYRLTENSTGFKVRATGPGIIVLTEAWWPDSFRVDVNDHAAPLVRVNHAFKGVVVDAAGDYQVTFSYWPKRFTRHLICSALGGGLLIVSLLFGLRRGQTRAQDESEAALAQMDYSRP